MERPVARDIEQRERGSIEAETKPLTIEGFDDFTAMLEEVNEDPLEPETKERLKQDFAEGRFKGFQVFEKDGVAGIAVVVDTYSAVHARKVLQLDELYIREAFRGKGLGKELFDTVVEYAKKDGYMRLEWRTEKDNITAQALYSQYETDTNSVYYLMEL
jgi:GNAT superfamily N-acetyltransferase